MDARDVQRRLIGWQRLNSNGALLTNCYVANSPWESDFVKVMKSLYWVEYEIKVSRSDFRADFAKSRYEYQRDENNIVRRVDVGKHDYYASSALSIGTRKVPRPKQFYFVCLPSVATVANIPEHAGLIYCDPNDMRGFGMRVEKRAPKLDNPTKLTEGNLYNLLYKLSWKLENANGRGSVKGGDS